MQLHASAVGDRASTRARRDLPRGRTFGNIRTNTDEGAAYVEVF